VLAVAHVALALALFGGVVAVEAKVLHGTPHSDRLIGTRHSDRLIGLGGKDVLRGGGSADKLLGGTGSDKLNGGPAYDVLMGGYGADKIHARDHHRDRIDCGPGHDKVFVDGVEDGVRNCEKVVEP
jgi:Ca2+-binding RTX toxin-like protein